MKSLQDIVNNAIHNHKRKNYELAKNSYEEALKISPQNLELNILYGTLLFETGSIEESLKLYTELIRKNKNLPILYFNRSVIYQKNENYQKALTDIDTCLNLKKNNEEALNRKAIILGKLSKNEEALEYLNQAIEINKNNPHYFFNKGNTLGRLNKFKEAIKQFDNAIKINQNYFKAYYGRAAAYEEVLQLDNANKDYDKAISINPKYYKATNAKARLLIRKGDFENGWNLFENRWEEKNIVKFKNVLNKPIWLGNHDLVNKTILLHSEQGLGDTIQFCRYLKLFEKSKTKIILQSPNSLVNILKTLDEEITVIKKNDETPHYDFHCPLMSLPLAFRTTVKAIPSKIPYLKTHKNKIEYWQGILGIKKKFRVGFAWSGNPNQINDYKRSFKLKELKNPLSEKFEWISLHNTIKDVDQKFISNNNIKIYQNKEHDFMDTAAICDLVDVVVSVDTSIAHLAAAIGKKVYLLLPYYPDFRWMLDDKKTPWYPNVSIFKHSIDSSWSDLVKSVQDEIILSDLNKSSK